MKTAQAELEGFLDRRSRIFEAALLNLLNAEYGGNGNYNDALSDLAKLIGDTMKLANLAGRKRALLEADYLRRKEETAKFAGLPDRNPIAYGVTFLEAVEDIVSREPRLAKSAEEVAELYNTEHVFAMAKSVSQKLTERVQNAIKKIMATGKGEKEATPEIRKLAAEESHDFARSYSQIVFRTNVSNSYNSGRFAQAKDPEVAKVVKALEIVGVDDVNTRRGRPEDNGEDHKAAFGLIAATDDPIWDKVMPPFSYQCRCGIIFVSKFELERKGLLRPDGSVRRYEPPRFSKFAAHPNFIRGIF